MESNFIIKKCNSCGAIVKVLKDCKCDGCGIKCCSEEMKTLIPNSVDAAVEKHLPVYEIAGNNINVKVPHVMEEEHFIEWITLVSDNKEYTVHLNPGNEAIAVFPYIPNSTLYAYCNKHGLWKAEVE